MCIKSCKPLNPRAPEWRPRQHPPPAPVAQPSQKLPLFYHTISFRQTYMPFTPTAWSHCYTPFTFPAAARFYELPQFGSVLKYADPINEKKSDESCVDKLESDGRKGVSKVWRLRPAAPPRRQWKPKIVADSEEVTVPRRPPRTTVMIRHIPNQLRRDFMLEFIDGYCSAYSLEYDFVYLPMDFIQGDNLGYAFVNFTSEGNALKFKKILHNYKWGDVKTENGKIYTSRKICSVTWARIQGKERLLKRFQGSVFACDSMDFLPVVFEPPRGATTTAPVVVGKLQPH